MQNKEPGIQSLPAFDLTGTPWLKGFAAASVGRLPPMYDRGAGFSAALHRRYFRGPWDLKHHVLRFDTFDALLAWDRGMRNTAPGWLSPYDTRPQAGVWRRPPEGRVYAGGRMRGHAAFTRNFVILVSGARHDEMIRRDPAIGKSKLGTGDVASRVNAITEELIRRALASRR